MQVVLVGQQNGSRRVRWMTTIGLALLLAFVLGVVGSLMYFVLAGQWSVLAALLPAMGGVVVVGVGLVRTLKTPAEKLTPLGRPTA
jgi:hypothetical protein